VQVLVLFVVMGLDDAFDSGLALATAAGRAHEVPRCKGAYQGGQIPNVTVCIGAVIRVLREFAYGEAATAAAEAL
jgi:hypothetical protein